MGSGFTGNFVGSAMVVKERMKHFPDSSTLSIHTLATKIIPQVLAPRNGERVLFITDAPADVRVLDEPKRAGRLNMLARWKTAFEQANVIVNGVLVHEETGKHSAPLPENGILVTDNTLADADLKLAIGDADIIIAMNQFSATAPLMLLLDGKRRAVSMPCVEEEMEPAMAADYSDIAETVRRIIPVLETFSLFRVSFAGKEELADLYVDVQGRKFHGDDGVCHKPGTLINFPSGEVYVAPFEGDAGNNSSTSGQIPMFVEGSDAPVLLSVLNNRIAREEIVLSRLAPKTREDLLRREGNCNIAEFALGLNPFTRTDPSTPVLELEKSLGIHWAYGISAHLGGAVGPDLADVHQDIVYPAKDPRLLVTVWGMSQGITSKLIMQGAELGI